jgi:hypothetical protein
LKVIIQSIKNSLLITLFCILLCACQIRPKVPGPAERYRHAKQELQQMFSYQPPVRGAIDFKQAISRGLQ